MSTIDLTKVAGFKAVDAEGNDMGIVSISEMTNMVKESIIQEAVAMQSVSTLAETSTLAATDTYEDRLPTSDTFSYVRTLDSSGNPKRTSQNALATVVGGLLPDATFNMSGLMPSRMNTEVKLVTTSNRQINLMRSNSNLYANALFSFYYGGFVSLFSVVCSSTGYTVKCLSNINNAKEKVKFYKKDNCIIAKCIDTTYGCSMKLLVLYTQGAIYTLEDNSDDTNALTEITIS